MRPSYIAAMRSRALPVAPTDARIQAHADECQRIIGYRFNDQELIREALNAAGSGNQRLAIAGDKVADVHLVARWYGTKASPSEWQVVRRELLCNDNLAKVGFRLRIDSRCGLSRGGSGIMATTVEAIIGAVWFDSQRDPAALVCVMDTLGLTTHPLLSPNTTTRKAKVWSNRTLPTRFFNGHHLALFRLLFNHGHSGLSPHHHTRDQQTEPLPTGMWSRLKSIFPTPKVMARTTPEPAAARPGRNRDRHGQEPTPADPTKLPEQRAPTPVLATTKQTHPRRSSAKLESTRPARHPVAQSVRDSSLAARHDKPTGGYPADTENVRLKWFVWSAIRDKSRSSADRKTLLDRLQCHRRALANLPDRSPKNIPRDCSTDGVCLSTYSTDESYDRQLVRHIEIMTRTYRRFDQKKFRGTLQPVEKSLLRDVTAQLQKLWVERLELWLLPDAQPSRGPNSLPNPGPTSASSSKAPSSDLPVAAAADSTASLIALPSENQHLQRSDPILWTSDASQHKSVDWKHYLKKPTSANERIVQSEARKVEQPRPDHPTAG